MTVIPQATHVSQNAYMVHGVKIHLNQHPSNYEWHFEDFGTPVADITAMETIGWTETDIGATARAVSVTAGSSYLLLNAGTAADSGTSIQYNAATSATHVARPHDILGPITSTATLMDGRELVFKARVGMAFHLTGWTTGLGAKAVFGWIVTDTAMMTAATGALAIGTGGGLYFHLTEAGALNFVTQRSDGTAAEVLIETVTSPSSATVIGNWRELEFNAIWVDASDDDANGVVHCYENGIWKATVENNLPMSSTEVYSVGGEALNGPAALDGDLDIGIDYILTGISRP
jgi:hypothetical protein